MIRTARSGECGRDGCHERIGRIQTYTGPVGQHWRLFCVSGRWRLEDGAWRHLSRERRPRSKEFSGSGWYLVLPATVACPRCGCVQLVDFPDVDNPGGWEPNSLLWTSVVSR
jgi:hypothetical protein